MRLSTTTKMLLLAFLRRTSAFTTQSSSRHSPAFSRILTRKFASNEKVWTTDAVRSTFREYFEKDNEHDFVSSSACAPLNDPTLLFTNAG